MQNTAETSLEEMRMRREVQALRDAMENAQFAHEQRLAQIAAAHRAEIDELQDMIRSQREVLDRERIAQIDAQSELRRQLGAENRALQEALVDARSAFDAERLALQARHQNELIVAGRVRADLETTVKQLRERVDGGA